jgi:hypothetical protein
MATESKQSLDKSTIASNAGAAVQETARADSGNKHNALSAVKSWLASRDEHFQERLEAKARAESYAKEATASVCGLINHPRPEGTLQIRIRETERRINGMMAEGYYTSGTNVLNISDGSNLEKVAKHETVHWLQDGFNSYSRIHDWAYHQHADESPTVKKVLWSGFYEAAAIFYTATLGNETNGNGKTGYDKGRILRDMIYDASTKGENKRFMYSMYANDLPYLKMNAQNRSLKSIAGNALSFDDEMVAKMGSERMQMAGYRLGIGIAMSIFAMNDYDVGKTLETLLMESPDHILGMVEKIGNDRINDILKSIAPNAPQS